MTLILKAISGVKWNAVSQSGRQILQFGVGVILARSIAPSEFGLLAMTIVFTGFATLFSELGFTAALIQKPNIDERHYSTVFWVNLVAGLLLWVLITALSPFVAAFYQEPKLRAVTMLVAVNFAIAPLNMVQKAILIRDLNFRTLAITELLATATGGAVAIIMAYRGFGIWSLVGQTLCVSATGVAALWLVATWRPRLKFDRMALRELTGFSTNLLAFNVLNYWIRNGDNLLVGKFLGNVSLGLYSRAYGLMLMPLSQVTSMIGRAMFPTLSRMQHDKKAAKNLYLKTVGLIALITFPLMVGLWAVAEHFVLGVYGQRWAGAIPVLKIFCWLGLAQSINASVGWIYQSQGRTGWLLGWGLSSGVLLVASILFGIFLGSIETVALCYALTSGGILLYPGIAIPGKLLNLQFSEVVRQVWPSFGCSIAMGGVIWFVGIMLPPAAPHILCLTLLAFLGVAVYFGLVYLFRLPQLEIFLSLVFRRSQNRKAAAVSTCAITE